MSRTSNYPWYHSGSYTSPHCRVLDLCTDQDCAHVHSHGRSNLSGTRSAFGCFVDSRSLQGTGWHPQRNSRLQCIVSGLQSLLDIVFSQKHMLQHVLGLGNRRLRGTSPAWCCLACSSSLEGSELPTVDSMARGLTKRAILWGDRSSRTVGPTRAGFNH